MLSWWGLKMSWSWLTFCLSVILYVPSVKQGEGGGYFPKIWLNFLLLFTVNQFMDFDFLGMIDIALTCIRAWWPGKLVTPLTPTITSDRVNCKSRRFPVAAGYPAFSVHLELSFIAIYTSTWPWTRADIRFLYFCFNSFSRFMLRSAYFDVPFVRMCVWPFSTLRVGPYVPRPGTRRDFARDASFSACGPIAPKYFMGSPDDEPCKRGTF